MKLRRPLPKQDEWRVVKGLVFYHNAINVDWISPYDEAGTVPMARKIARGIIKTCDRVTITRATYLWHVTVQGWRGKRLYTVSYYPPGLS